MLTQEVRERLHLEDQEIVTSFSGKTVKDVYRTIKIAKSIGIKTRLVFPVDFDHPFWAMLLQMHPNLKMP